MIGIGRLAAAISGVGAAALFASGCLIAGTPTLTGVTQSSTACNGPNGNFAGCSLRDSVTFTFFDAIPASTTITDDGTTRPSGPSGQPTQVDGERFVTVTLNSAVAHDAAGAPTSQRAVYSLGTHRIAETALVEDFEGYVRYVIGLRGTAAPSVTTARTAHTFWVALV